MWTCEGKGCVTSYDLGFLTALSQNVRGSASIDLSGLRQTRSRHSDWVFPTALAWWLLGADIPPGLEVRLPKSMSARRHLLRTGVVAACRRRCLETTGWNGVVHGLPQETLPHIAWENFDDGAGIDKVRVLPDLEDRRTYPAAILEEGRRYPWLNALGLESPSLKGTAYRRFISDADTVLYELVDNVHRWSNADRALATVAKTKGGGRSPFDQTPRSWNRLHVVIMDSGRGIPQSLRSDQDAWDAVVAAAGKAYPSEWLLKQLLEHAFGGRAIPNHNGHGLHASNALASQWIGEMDLLTVDPVDPGAVLYVRNREGTVTIEDRIHLPGARGTLVHVLLQGVDRSESARTGRQMSLLASATSTPKP